MKNHAETSIPSHLRELLQPTPSGTAKLLAAWDGLTPETQIAVLAAKKEQPGPAYLYQQIIEKALTSDNAFVRYMAARETSLNDRDEREKNLRKQIDNDPEPLVRYAPLETERVISDPEIDDPETFFALPHEARLAKVRRLTSGGEEVAKLISYAVEHQLKDGRVSEIELFEILTDYLIKPELKERYVELQHSYDGYGRVRSSRDIQALWELVLNAPENLSHVIIEHLPESAGLGSDIPEQVLEGMSDRQLQTLFYRSDIGLEKFRKQKFFEITEGGAKYKDHAKDAVRHAAAVHAFDLTNEEFAELLKKPKKQRVTILKDLAMSRDLRLCLFDAIHDALFVPEVGGDYYENAEFAKIAFERKLKQLEGWQREKELRELKLYRLAVQVVPWKKDKKGYPPSGELAFLEEAIVDGNTWGTFMAFAAKWGETTYRTRRFEKHLPKIWEAGEEDDDTVQCEQMANDDETELANDGENMNRVTDEDADTLTEGEAQSLAREWIDNRIPKPKGPLGFSQTRSLMDDLAKICIAESRRNRENEDGLNKRLYDAWNIIFSTWRAAAPEYATEQHRDEVDQPDEEEARKIEDTQHVIWERRDPYESLSLEQADQHTDFNFVKPNSAIAEYLERPWLRHPFLDWVLIDMSVSRELCDLGEAVKQRLAPRKREKLINDHHRYFYHKYFVTKGESTTITGKPDRRLEPFLLWDEMYEVWLRLRGPVVNPSRVREAMVQSTEHGAEWGTLTWSLIDRIISIDPAVWIIWPSRS